MKTTIECETKTVTKDNGNAESKVTSLATRYAGYIHFWGTQLLIDSPIDGDVDIHGVGCIGEKSAADYVHGVLHCVLSTQTCIRLALNDIHGKSFDELRHCTTLFSKATVTVKLPYEVQERQLSIDVIRVPVELPSPKEMKKLKGTNDLTDKDVQDCYVFEKGCQSDEIDLTVIIGIMPLEIKQEDVLLLMRFHSHIKYESDFASTIFNSLIGKDKKNAGCTGFEVARSGGSGGLTTSPYNDRLLQFFHHHHSSSPRVSKALKVIQKRTTYKIYYIGVQKNKRKVARATYTPPRLGGTFKIDPAMFGRMPFFVDFAETKIIGALVLRKIGTMPGNVIIAPESVSQELEHLRIADIVSTNCKDVLKKRKVVLTLFNEFNMHSIVCYNVGYHVDCFDKGMPSLENKIVFKLHHRHAMNERALVQDQSRGGGQRLGEFHFALLDWGRNRRKREAALQMGIIQPNQQVTQRVIQDFFQANPNLQRAFDAAIA